MRFLSFPAIFLSLFLLSPLNAQSELRIVSLGAIDSGDLSLSETSPSLDVKRGTCSEDNPEPFFDTFMRIGLRSDYSSTVRITSVRYRISRPYGTRGVLTTKSFTPISSGEIRPGKDITYLDAFLLDVTGSTKAWAGETSAIPSDLGFKKVKVSIRGRDSRGRAVSASAATMLSLDDFNRCE